MPLMKNISYDEFWREKEKKYGTKFCYSTFARYLFNYPESWDSTGGLLYFSESVVCFENFKSTNLFYNMVNKEDFKKIEMEIFMNTIVKVSNGYGESRKEKIGFFKRLTRGMDAFNKLLLINTKDKQEEKVYAFSLAESPFVFCSKIAPFLPR
jgi:hypothetical protein